MDETTQKRSASSLESNLCDFPKIRNGVPDYIREVYNQNAELRNAVRTLEGEKEDLICRLNITIQSVYELKNQLEEEQKNKFDASRIENNYKTEKEANEKIMSDLNNQILNLKNQIEETNKKFQNQENVLSSILASANNYFDQEIREPELLIQILKTPKNSNSENKEINSKPHKKKRKNKLIKVLKSEHDLQILQIKKSYENSIKEINFEIETIKNKYKLLKSENKDLKDLNEKLLNENSSLVVQIQTKSAEEQSKSTSEINELNAKIKLLLEQLKDSEEAKESGKKQIQILLNKIHNFEQIKEEKITKIEQLKEENKTFQFKKHQYEEKIKELTEVIEKDQIQIKTQQKTISELQEENNKIKIQLNNKITESQNYSNIIDDKIVENELLNENIQTLKSQIENLTKLYNEQSQLMNDTIKQKPKQITTKMNKPKIQQNNDSIELISLATSSINEFPDELTKMITQIQNNNSLQAPTKLRHIFLIISNYFQSKNERINKELKTYKEKNDILQENIDNINQLFKEIFPEISSLNDKECMNKLKLLIQKLKMKIKKSKEKITEFENKIFNILILLKADNLQSAEEAIKQFQNNIFDLNKEMKNKKKIINQTNNLMNKQKEKISFLEQQISELNDQIQKQNEEKCSIEKQIKENEILFNTKETNFINKISQLNQQIKDQQIKYYEIVGKSELISQQNVKLENTIQMIKQQNKILRNAKEELQNKNNKIINENKQKHSFECETFQQKFLTEIEQMKNQIFDLQNEIDSLNNINKKLQNEKNEFQTQNTDLLMKLKTMEMKLNNIKKEIEREKQLIEMKHNTQLINIQHNYQNKLVEYKTKLNDLKRTTFAYIAFHFCSLFDVNEELNEDNFEYFICNIKSKMSSLMNMEAKVRKMLKIGPKQSIENAIATILLNKM